VASCISAACEARFWIQLTVLAVCNAPTTDIEALAARADAAIDKAKCHSSGYLIAPSSADLIAPQLG
jgi:hypothetical protein